MHKKQQNHSLFYIGIIVAIFVYVGSTFGVSVNQEKDISAKYILSLLALVSLPLPFFAWGLYQQFDKKYVLWLAYFLSIVATLSLLYIFTQ